MDADPLALVPRSPPSFDDLNPGSLRPDPRRRELFKEKRRERIATRARHRAAWLAAHPGEPWPRRPTAPPERLIPVDGQPERLVPLDQPGVSVGDDITEMSVDLVAAASPATARDDADRARGRPITQLPAPRLPTSDLVSHDSAVAALRTRGARGRGGPVSEGRGPAGIRGLRQQFPRLSDYARKLASTPRQPSVALEDASTDNDDSQTSLVVVPQSESASADEPAHLMDGVRALFVSADGTIPSVATTVIMENVHKRGAVVHDRLVLTSESVDSHTTHIIAVRSGQKKMTFKAVMKALGLVAAEDLFGETTPLAPDERRPHVIDQQWASDALRKRRRDDLLYSETLHHILPRRSLPALLVAPLPAHGEDRQRGRSQNTQGSPVDPSQRRRSPLAYKPPQITTEPDHAIQSDGEEERLHGATEWGDLAEFIERAARGQTVDDELIDAPKARPMAGFVGRVEATESEEVTDPEERNEGHRVVPKRRNKTEEDIWACQRKSVYGSSRVACEANRIIVDVLSQLAEDYDRVGDYWRLSTCRKVLGLVRNRSGPLNTFAQCRSIHGIGDSMARKIAEIRSTGTLARLTNMATVDRAAILFARCYGIGPSEAGKLARQGARRLGDLQPGNDLGIKLTQAQLLGLEHYDDLRDRMPREEAKAIHQIIEDVGKSLDPHATFQIMGSYRRGQPDCGDIDILISRNPSDGRDHRGLIESLIRTLFTSSGLLKHTLSEPSDWKALDAKWMGLCALENGKMRRIDILGVPHDEMPAALIYFTGNDIFNRSVRLKARKMGYSLNQRGLFKDLIRDPRSKLKVTEGRRVHVRSEQDIFKILGVKWRPPEERLP